MKKIIITLTTFLILSCNKNDDESILFKDKLPEISSTGANTFGVVINNTIYLPKSSINDLYNTFGPKYNGVNLQINDKSLSCLINIDSKNKTYVFLFIDDESGLASKEYLVNEKEISTPGRVTIVYDIFNKSVETTHYKAVPNSGSIKLNKNDNDIISGTFNCKLINEKNSNDIIEVKEGKFDFNKTTINDFVFPKKTGRI
jgi:hypothetical protein